MTNQEVSEFMQRFLDDDLNEEELESLMEHIRQTPASAAIFERLQRLDSELESLPKVIPPVSIVDSILPRLELAGLVEHPPLTGTTASDDMVDRNTRISRRTSIRERVNYRLLGGVVAAGIVLTLFITNIGPQLSFDMADEDNASANEQMEKVSIAGTSSNSTSDSTAEPAPMSAFEAPSAPNSEPSANATSSKAAPAQAMTEAPWIDQGSMARVGAEDSRISSNEPGESSRMGIASSNDAPSADMNASASTDNKSFQQANEEPADNQTMLTMKQPTPAIASPDEKLSGLVTNAVEGGQHIIISDQSGRLVYESAVYEGTITELSWSPDSSQLHFEVASTNEDIMHMTIDLSAMTEKIKE